MKPEDQTKENRNQDKKELPSDLIEGARGAFSIESGDPLPPPATSREEARLRTPEDSTKEAFAIHVHSYVSDYIKFADQKAAFIFALSAALLCYLFKNNVQSMWLKPLGGWSLLDSLCFAGIFLLTIGLIFSCLVIVPSLRKTHRGIVFFHCVSKFDSADVYANEVLSNVSIQLLKELLEHTYDLSRICSAKYWKLSTAIWFTSGGVILAVLVLILTPR